MNGSKASRRSENIQPRREMKQPYVGGILFIGALPTVQLVLGLMNPYAFYPLSVRVVQTVLVHTACFYGSVFVALQFFKNKGGSSLEREHGHRLPRYYAVVTMAIVLFDLSMSVMSMRFVLNTGISLQEARDTFFFVGIYGTDYAFGDIAILMWTVMAMRVFILVRLAPVFLASPSKQNTTLFVLISSSFLLSDVSTGGRTNTFYFGVIVACVLLLMNKGVISRRAQRTLNRVAIVGALSVSAITFQRLDAGQRVAPSLYKYLVGPLYAYDAAIGDPDGLVHNPEMRFGSSFSSLDWAIVGVTKKLGWCECETLATIVNPVMASGYYFANDEGINAFFTGYLSYMLDFGALGAVVSGTLFGFGLVCLTTQAWKLESARLMAMAVLASFAAVLFVRENVLSAPWMLMAIAMTLFLPIGGGRALRRGGRWPHGGGLDANGLGCSVKPKSQ